MTYTTLKLQNLILTILQHEARGRAKALPRYALEQRLGIDKAKDRAFREAYAALPVCTCDDGMFIPTVPEDLEEYGRYLEPKVGPGIRHEKLIRLRLAYPELLPPPVEIQQELFG